MIMPWTKQELMSGKSDDASPGLKVTEEKGDPNFVAPDLGEVKVRAGPIPIAKGNDELLEAVGRELADRLPVLHNRGTFTGGKWLVRAILAERLTPTRIALDVAIARPGLRGANESHYRALVESLAINGELWKAATVDVDVAFQAYLPSEMFKWEDGAMRITDTAHIVLMPNNEAPNASKGWVGL